MKPIDFNRDRLFEICEKHKVKALFLFGSILTNNFKESSDIDILV